MTQSSFIFCVVTKPLSRYCNTCYLTAAILYFLATMDSIIRQAVREELRRSSSSRPETASSTNQDDQGRSENESEERWGGALRDDTKNGCEGDYSWAIVHHHRCPLSDISSL